MAFQHSNFAINESAILSWPNGIGDTPDEWFITDKIISALACIEAWLLKSYPLVAVAASWQPEVEQFWLINGAISAENETLSTHAVTGTWSFLQAKNTKTPQKIISNDFHSLWIDFWAGEIFINSTEYNDSKNKFELLRTGFINKKNDISIFVNIDILLDNAVKIYKEPEWGFPKGRRNLKEKNIECGKREFSEETNIKEEDYNIINICPFEETFMASNNNKYKHIYYIGQVKDVNINPYGEVASLIVTLISLLPKLCVRTNEVLVPSPMVALYTVPAKLTELVNSTIALELFL